MIKQATKRELIKSAIEELADANGVVSAEAVFEAAKSTNSVLHDEFIWDGNQAVKELGLQRAAQLIRTIRVEIVVESHKIVVPYYVNDPRDSKPGEYLPVANVRNDDAMKHGVLINEISRIESAIKRARAIAGVLEIENEFESMMESVNIIRDRIQVPA